MKRALSQALRVSSTIASRGVGSIALRARVAAAHEQQESKLPLASLSFRRTFSTATEPKEAEVVDLKENGVEKELTPEEAEAALRDFEDEKSFDFNDMNLGGFNRPAAPSGEVREDIKVDAKTEKIKGSTVSKTFQTETRQILDIVTNSLYTDKEVFLRELISNASDALEKGRFYKTKDELVDPEVPFEVRIFTDENAKTITIQDTGVGMTGEELVSLLGTIARSGSKQWTKEKAGSSDASNIIGQFGVGFYSAFMVGDKVEVFTRSAKVDKDGKYVFFCFLYLAFLPFISVFSIYLPPIHPLVHPPILSYTCMHVYLAMYTLCHVSVICFAMYLQYVFASVLAAFSAIPWREGAVPCHYQHGDARVMAIRFVGGLLGRGQLPRTIMSGA